MECVHVRDVDFFLHVSIATFGFLCDVFSSSSFLNVTSHIVGFFFFFFPSFTGMLVLIPVLISLYRVSLFLSHLHVYSQGSSINSGFWWAQFFVDNQADSRWYMMIPDDFMTIDDNS